MVPDRGYGGCSYTTFTANRAAITEFYARSKESLMREVQLNAILDYWDAHNGVLLAEII